jgi:3-phenylpropionate/trans-cinnamate dioxygenase ferredoxin reductase component
VIVGASVAGGKAAETLRSEGFQGRIVLVGAEAELPYERPPLSKGVLLGNDEPDVTYLHDQAWYDENSIELRLGAVAASLDAKAREVVLEDGERVAYDKLLLATGSTVKRLPIPGADLSGVHYLRTMGESLALRSAFGEGKNVVVIGAGWIGLETAAAARSHGASVTVVERFPTPLFSVLGSELGVFFADLHRDNGVEFRFGQGVLEIEGSEDGAVRAVQTSDGSQLPADVVIVGVGIAPNTALAESGGLIVNDGVVTDRTLCTSNVDVFAAGDVARWPSPLYGKPLRVEHWANANDGGEAVAKAMLGQDVTYDPVPFFFSDQYDLGMEYSGFVERADIDKVVIRGSLETRELIAFWLRDDQVVAGMNVNVWDVQDDIQALIRSGRAVDRAKLADPNIPLGDVYAS